MKIFVALFVWFLMAAILTLGVVMSVKGSFWLLGVGLIGFILAIAKIGCLTHD